jgi:hypothetical protein
MKDFKFGTDSTMFSSIPNRQDSIMTDGGLAWEFEAETLEEIGIVLLKLCKN